MRPYIWHPSDTPFFDSYYFINKEAVRIEEQCMKTLSHKRLLC
ncbi:hypothetical protein BSUBE1_2877 [Bacillus subtilis E1]|nr:hypothetical protein BS732_3568 [Bacillus subtilis MB73/2]CCU59508.1 hypothetical protein BSUBE1_2877 [Bacillus subtilis E1]